MFLRLFTAIGVLFAALTICASAALATDEPAPAPSSKPCVDNMRPLSRLNATFKRDLHRGLLRGIAIDQGCGADGAGNLKVVRVAVSRKLGKRCQHLMANGRLSKIGSCRHVWLPAKGKSAWTFKLRHRLPHGKYLVATSAVDASGNIEAQTKR
jgi:hypothetical protein